MNERQQMEADDLLTDAQLVKLTGRHQKSRQIEWLKAEGIPFRVSATGHPTVTWTGVNGKKVAAQPTGWKPRAMGGA